MNKGVNRRKYFDEEQQKQNFLDGLLRSLNPHITSAGLKMAKSFGVEEQYRQIIEDKQKELSIVISLANVIQNAKFLKEKSESLSGEIDSYGEELETIYYKKMEEYLAVVENGSLTSGDRQICFDLACKEFSSFHPGESHAWLFSTALKKLIDDLE